MRLTPLLIALTVLTSAHAADEYITALTNGFSQYGYEGTAAASQRGLLDQRREFQGEVIGGRDRILTRCSYVYPIADLDPWFGRMPLKIGSGIQAGMDVGRGVIAYRASVGFNLGRVEPFVGGTIGTNLNDQIFDDWYWSVDGGLRANVYTTEYVRIGVQAALDYSHLGSDSLTGLVGGSYCEFRF